MMTFAAHINDAFVRERYIAQEGNVRRLHDDSQDDDRLITREIEAAEDRHRKACRGSCTDCADARRYEFEYVYGVGEKLLHPAWGPGHVFAVSDNRTVWVRFLHSGWVKELVHDRLRSDALRGVVSRYEWSIE